MQKKYGKINWFTYMCI